MKRLIRANNNLELGNEEILFVISVLFTFVHTFDDWIWKNSLKYIHIMHCYFL